MSDLSLNGSPGKVWLLHYEWVLENSISVIPGPLQTDGKGLKVIPYRKLRCEKHCCGLLCI